MNENLRLSFISSIVMIAVATAFILGSVQIYRDAGVEWYTSPALIPAIVSGALLFVSLILAAQSLKNGGLRARLAESRTWFVETATRPYTIPTLIGITLMALYTFALLPLMPFWASSTLFMLAMLFFLRAAKWWVIGLVSGGVVSGIYLLFNVILRAPLP